MARHQLPQGIAFGSGEVLKLHGDPVRCRGAHDDAAEPVGEFWGHQLEVERDSFVHRDGLFEVREKDSSFTDIYTLSFRAVLTPLTLDV